MSKKKISPEVQAIMSAVDAGHFATTVFLVQRFLADNPNSQRAWLDLGIASGQLGRYEQAKAAFEKVIELEPGAADSAEALAANAPIFGELGNLERNRGDFLKAKAWYEKQIAAAPQDATGHLYLGNLCLRLGEFETAIRIFETALQCQTVCLEEAHYSLGVAHRSLGQYPAARDHFQQAVACDANFVDAKAALKDTKSALTLSQPL